MHEGLTKTELLDRLKAGRRAWEAALEAISPAILEEPGAAGHWSVKDIIAHVSAYEHWLVEWLTAAANGEFPPPSPLDDADVERRNARVFEQTHHLAKEIILKEATRTFDALLEAISRLPDEDFTDPARAEWYMKPYWSKKRTVAAAVANLTIEHYDEHLPGLAAWAAAFPAG